MSAETIRALILAAAISLAGFLAGNGFARARSADRYVTVKGVSEREAKADLAIWPLSVVGADNTLAAAHAKLEASITGVRQFLARHGIDTAQIELTGFSVSDALAQEYGPPERMRTNRYIIRETLMVRSQRPDLVLAASQRIAELAAIGVVVSSGPEYRGPGGGPTFVFTGLNKLKPPMIAEATARAREGAEQFARDSRSDLAGIRRANQGVFEILARDQAPGIGAESQINKLVRVVSTVEYLLKD
ncbi:MAG TPA: SIMPL domain-containing protein [Gemmatimonadaceae bacterium]|nr:SIMPL domain-containing protein [Gemmatimonadaceae bacterium]